MNISENKRVVLLAAVFGVAFIGIMYKGYESYSAAKESSAQLGDIRAEFENYNVAEFPPTTASLSTLRKAQEKAVALNKELESAMGRYAAATKSSTQGINTPVDFQNSVNAAIAATKKDAEAKKVKLGPGAADLGMANFKNTAAIASEVPYRAFMLAAVKNITSIIIDAEAVAVDKIYCGNLPKEADTGARNVPEYFPLNMEVSFTAKRGTLPQVLNSIVKNKSFFYLITGISVESDISLPSIARYEEPVLSGEDAPLADGDVPIGDAPLEDESSIARPMTGLPDESVRVHLNLEVLYFSK